MLVKDIMQSEKIHTISGDANIHEAAVRMAELNIGALIVGIPEKIEGMFSERDILKKVAGNDLSYEITKVKDVMTTEVFVVEDKEMAYIALNIMQKKKFRHLPVVNEKGICVGMVSIRDLMKSVSNNIKKENKKIVRHIFEEKK
jgi:CBS domain-containing protein